MHLRVFCFVGYFALSVFALAVCPNKQLNSLFTAGNQLREAVQWGEGNNRSGRDIGQSDAMRAGVLISGNGPSAGPSALKLIAFMPPARSRAAAPRPGSYLARRAQQRTAGEAPPDDVWKSLAAKAAPGAAAAAAVRMAAMRRRCGGGSGDADGAAATTVATPGHEGKPTVLGVNITRVRTQPPGPPTLATSPEQAPVAEEQGSPSAARMVIVPRKALRVAYACPPRAKYTSGILRWQSAQTSGCCRTLHRADCTNAMTAPSSSKRFKLTPTVKEPTRSF